tara:strand:+ start:766 stop:1026 length:261 start_codon:yes stop_codon:yes gene_type:complete
MPDCSNCNWLISYAIDYGFKPEWSELNAWNNLNNMKLNRFESKAIYTMSVAYKNSVSLYDNTDKPRPFVGNTRLDNDIIKSTLRSF